MTRANPEILAWLDRMAQGDLRDYTPVSDTEEALAPSDAAILDRLRALRQQWQQERADIVRQTVIRIQDEEAAFEREARIFAVQSDAVVILNSAGEITRANQAFLDLVDRTMADLMGQKIGRFLESEPDPGSVIAQLKEHPAVRDVSGSLGRRGGGNVDVSISASAVRTGTQTELVMVARDLTETQRRLAAEAAVHAERERATELRGLLDQLEHSNRELAASRRRLLHADRLAAIGQMAAGVAHEINNPATFVVTNLELLHESVEQLETLVAGASGAHYSRMRQMLAESLDMLRQCTDGMLRIRSITRDLNAFSRIEREGMERIDVNELLKLAARMVRNELKPRGKLVLELHAVPEILADRGKLAQVMINLVVNAAQSLDETQRATNEIVLASKREGGGVLVEVSDTGAGIPPAVLPRIFEPFFTTKPRDAGTGLGLSLSAEIIRAHGGTIDVKSELGVGTTFRMRLPLDARSIPSACG